MKILRKDTDLNILLNTETDFQTNLGWEESLKEFETEILSDIINPIENYETVRYIHKPYTSSGVTQTDIWFYFYFQSGGTYVQDYTPQGISSQENENMLKQATESFFRLEFFKTPIKNWNSDSTYKITELVTYNGNTYTSLLNSNKNNNPLTSSGKWVLSSLNSQVYEPPTRQNRKLIFAKNLSLPLGEKMFYNPLNGYIHLPVFRGSNYSNKENMYFFWFQDESVLTETNLSGTTTGNTFFMTAKFYNAKDGSITDFTNDSYSTGHTITEQNDMYYQVDINKTDYSYQVYFYNGVVKCEEVGLTNKPIMFFERGGGTAPSNILYHICSNVTPTPTPTATNTPTPTRTPAVTPTNTPTSTNTPTPTPTPTTDTTVYYWYALGDCNDMRYTYTQVTNSGFGIITISGFCGLPSAMDYSDPAHTAYYFDTSNPCGFGTGYTGVYNARSSTQLTEGDVYTISGTCYSIIELNSEPPTWTINMDGKTKEEGANPCFDCQPPFTGFTYYTYSGVTCGNVPDEIIVYDISPYVLNSISPQIGQLYLYHEYDVNGTLVNPGNSCVEITGYIGEFVGPKVTVPLPGGISGSTYSVPVGPILTGGGEITDCTECIPHWNITTVRCDGDLTDLIGYPIWSTTKPAINSVIKTNANDGVCRKVTDVFPLKSIPYLGGYIGNMHPQIYYVSSSYGDCNSCP
jgi:hypothetical protein